MASAEEKAQRLEDEPTGLDAGRIARPFSIVCLSSQPWDIALCTNRQQVMLRAARLGHRVLFVETGHFLRKHVGSLLDRRERRSLARRIFATEEVVPGVVVRKAHNVLPRGSLTAGKPVVASGVPELAGMEPDVALANRVPAFVKAAQNAVGREGDGDRLRRKQLAPRNTWETKTERLFELVHRELEADGPMA